MRDATQIIVRPLLTEKSVRQQSFHAFSIHQERPEERNIFRNPDKKFLTKGKRI